MKGSFGLNRLVRKAQNLERKVEFDLIKRGATKIETYKNRCLGYIERVGQLTNVSTQDKRAAVRKMFKVYFNLQDFEGPEKETDMEVPLEELLQQLDMAVVEANSADVRSGGGLGFSSVNGLMLAEGLAQPKNPYWNALNSVKTQAPIYDPNYVYKPKQTMVQWRVEVKEQKKEMLDQRAKILKAGTVFSPGKVGLMTGGGLCNGKMQ